MVTKRSIGISRRAFLRNAVVTTALAASASAITAASPAAASGPNTITGLEDEQPAVNEYVENLPASEASSDWTYLEGVHDEYQRAVATFPFSLPDGYRFPAESRIKDPVGELGVRHSIGAGGADAFMFWVSANATASYAAHLRGDAVTATRYINAIVNIHDSPVRRMYFDDPENYYLRAAVEPAQTGDFTTLVNISIAPFLADPTSRAIAAAAGDKF